MYHPLPSVCRVPLTQRCVARPASGQAHHGPSQSLRLGPLGSRVQLDGPTGTFRAEIRPKRADLCPADRPSHIDPSIDKHDADDAPLTAPVLRGGVVWWLLEMSFFRVVATHPAPQFTSNYPHLPRISYGLPATHKYPLPASTHKYKYLPFASIRHHAH